jgi:hypothetical protein
MKESIIQGVYLKPSRFSNNICRCLNYMLLLLLYILIFWFLWNFIFSDLIKNCVFLVFFFLFLSLQMIFVYELLIEYDISTLVLPLHKYNVPTLSPFAITNDSLMTFHVLSVNMDIQPSLDNYPVEIRFFLKSGTCLTSFNNHWFPLRCFIFTFPIPTILHGASSPK